MTDKQKERLNELLEKVLTKKRSLDKQQLKELYDLLALQIADLEGKKADTDSSKERFSIACDIGYFKGMKKQVIKLQEQSKPLSQRVSESIAYMESETARMKAENDRLKKEREEKEYYAEYERKYNDLNNVW